ncbi:unnamed protein product [Ectocarpus sp. 13 AM-2016]
MTKRQRRTPRMRGQERRRYAAPNMPACDGSWYFAVACRAAEYIYLWIPSCQFPKNIQHVRSCLTPSPINSYTIARTGATKVLGVSILALSSSLLLPTPTQLLFAAAN